MNEIPSRRETQEYPEGVNTSIFRRLTQAASRLFTRKSCEMTQPSNLYLRAELRALEQRDRRSEQRSALFFASSEASLTPIGAADHLKPADPLPRDA